MPALPSHLYGGALVNLAAKHHALTASKPDPNSSPHVESGVKQDLLARLQAARERTRTVDDPQLTLLEVEHGE